MGFPFKSAQYCRQTEGVRLLRGDNIVQRNLRWDGARYWPTRSAAEFVLYSLRPGDVVLAMDRPWIDAGLKVSALRDADCPALLVQRVARLRARDGLDQGFLRWLLYSQSFTNHVLAVQTGTAVPHISGEQIRDYRFLMPPLGDQRTIAGVLGALEDLIDTNRRLSRGSSMLAVNLASAAPDQVPLRELARVVDAQQFRPEGSIDHFSIPAFDERKLPERVDGAAIKSSKLRLTGPTVLVSRLNPQTPRVWMAYPRYTPAAASTEFVTLQSRPEASVEEVWAACASGAFASQMRSRVTGTTGSHQRVDKLAIPSLLVADVRIMDRATRTAISLLVREAHESLIAASEAARIRDELLPLLLSGRVRVEKLAA